MVRWIDNGYILGWYFVTEEGFIYGDGTLEYAKRVEARWYENN